MKLILPFILAFLPICSFGQRNIPLGQGVLNIDIESLPSLLFFSDTNDKKPARSIHVIRDKDGEYRIKEGKTATWFAPESVWLDYYIFIFRVDTSMGKWYRVFVKDDKTLWLHADHSKRFKLWRHFLLKETTSITKLKEYNLPIKAHPSDTAKTIKMMESEDCFQVLDIKGDWTKIKTNEVLDCDGSKQKIKSGWIRWKQSSHLTIEYGLSC